MDVIGQDTDRDRFEGPALLHDTVSLPQTIDLFGQQFAGAIGKHDCEEERAAFDARATIVRHASS
jgi:hypothetical protein